MSDKTLSEELRLWADRAHRDMGRVIAPPLCHSNTHECPIADLIGWARKAADRVEELEHAAVCDPWKEPCGTCGRTPVAQSKARVESEQ